ncbi:glycosyltransferase family 2 protein [Clostridium sp. FP2]|uniref:glycosyltransferase family 2 protein n=1 Tax=Clostridium sp. FP2 TaxID=2724481 RepID=UPI0013E9098B|nr:glycosyltransferase family 2 protein [Clostridium sp. FP2]MBZ9624561.1 glycosyltransferase family 2 protein [Clostridium sp. FP2]
MKKPLITICIPTYNRAKLLEYMLKSILPQVREVKDIVEIIISDNCSSDNTQSIVKGFQEKYKFIRYNRNFKNIGACKNIELLTTKLATGEYSWVIGDDDMIVSGGIKEIIDIIQKNLELDYFFVNYFSKDISERNDIISKFHSIYQPIEKEIQFKETKLMKVDKWQNIYMINRERPLETFTAILSNILRTTAWKEQFKLLSLNEDSLSFDSLDNTYPHLIIVSKSMLNKPAYYIGKPIVLLGFNSQEWINKLSFILVNRLNDVIELQKELGIETEILEVLIEDYFEKYLIRIVDLILDGSYDVEELKKILWKYSQSHKFTDFIFNLIKNKCLKQEEVMYNEFVENIFMSLITEKSRKFKKIAVWGTGDIAKILVNKLLKNDIHISLLIDSNINKNGTFFLDTNIVIKSPEYIKEKLDAIIITSMGNAEKIKKIIIDNKLTENILSV